MKQAVGLKLEMQGRDQIYTRVSLSGCTVTGSPLGLSVRDHWKNTHTHTPYIYRPAM